MIVPSFPSPCSKAVCWCLSPVRDRCRVPIVKGTDEYDLIEGEVGSFATFIDTRKDWSRNVSRNCSWDRYWGRAGQLLANFFPLSLLQCDYCNRGHLDKVDQSDYMKITIHSKKVGCRPISDKAKQNNKLLEAQNLNNDSKRFSTKQNVSEDNVCVFKTLHITAGRHYLFDTSRYFVIYQQILRYSCRATVEAIEKFEYFTRSSRVS